MLHITFLYFEAPSYLKVNFLKFSLAGRVEAKASKIFRPSAAPKSKILTSSERTKMNYEVSKCVS